MAMTATDLPAFLEGIPPGDWVAFSEAQIKVLAHGADPDEVRHEAMDKGEPLPLIVRVPERQMTMFL
jgi:hypothetical protein